MYGFVRMRVRLALALLLIAATLVVYWQVLGHEFINYDDQEYVTENTRVQAGLTGKGIAWAFTATRASNWHPLTWMSHMLDCQVYKLDPMGHHLTNLLFHVANTLLLFLVLGRMTGSVWRSGFVAALFAVHPVHVESVAWVAERKDVLSTFFWLLTMLAYVRYARNPGLRRYLPVVLLFALGLMAKPMLVTLPFVLLLLDYWPLGRFEPRERTQGWVGWKLVWEKSPLFVLSAASSVVTYIVQQKSGAMGTFEEFALPVRIANVLAAYASYIGKMVWPRDLAIFYPHPGGALWSWRVIGSGLLLVCVSLLALWFRGGRRHPYLAVGWLWYVGTLVPVIGLVQVGLQAMADRYTYVPLIGLFIVVGWGIPDLLAGCGGLGGARRILLGSAAAILVSALMIGTWFQLGSWRNRMTLFEHALRVTAGNYLAHTNLGVALEEQGKTGEAMAHFSKALEINPNDPYAHCHVGLILAERKRTEEAVAEFLEALRIAPGLVEVHTYLGDALAEQGKLAEAVEQYSKVLKVRPDDPKAHSNLGMALAKQGKMKEAVERFSRALRIDPSFAEAHNNLGNALVAQGKLEEAVACFSEALRLDPADPQAHNNFALALAKQGKADEAIREYRRAIRLKPDFAEAHNNLAVALYFKGDYAGAWKEAHLCQRYGFRPHPGFLEALSRKMVEPVE